MRGLERVGGFGGKSDVLAAARSTLGDPGRLQDLAAALIRAPPPTICEAAAKRWLSDGSFVLEVTPYPPLKQPPRGGPLQAAGSRHATLAAKLPKLERATLSNGLKMMLAERHELPLVNFWHAAGCRLRGRSVRHSRAPRALAMTVLSDGTKTRNALKSAMNCARSARESGANSSLDTSSVSLVGAEAEARSLAGDLTPT